ncbi:MAG TPA: CoA transferase [Chloroflexota bacterium]|nr:CoA transferase [Chloroflexota bacterium]
MVLPLDGIRIIDFTQVQQGPTCTMFLADFGAEVIKIEPLGTGEFYRHWHGKVRGLGAPWLSMNRNKKSIGVNLKTPEGQQIIHRLARVSDVVTENFRPGVMDRLGIGYEALRQLNPRIIFASSSGFGQTGPYAKWKGQDLIGQALAGIPLKNGFDGDPPIAASPPFADFTAGNMLAQGILLALLAREKTGVGQRLETSLMNGMLAADMQSLTSSFNSDQKEPRGRRRRRTDIWPYAVYPTREGPMLLITNIFSTDPMQKLCAALGIDDLSPRYPTEDEQNEHGAEIRAIVDAVFLTKSTKEWLEVLARYELIAAPLNSPSAMLEDPQILHNEMVMEVEHPFGGDFRTVGFPLKLYGTPAEVRCGPPRLGQHTEEVLHLAGYSDAEVTDLIERKVVENEAPQSISSADEA